MIGNPFWTKLGGGGGGDNLTLGKERGNLVWGQKGGSFVLLFDASD